MSDSSTSATCQRCGKPLRGGSRFCVSCGHNNFDADKAADDVSGDLLRAGISRKQRLGFARWFGFLLRFFR